MPSFLNSKFKLPNDAQAVLLTLISLSCFSDTSRQITIAGVSGLGVWSLAAGGAVWAAWLLRPVLPKGLLIIFLPLIFFGMDAAGTLLWYRPDKPMDGTQLLVVGLTFLGTMMLSARETAADPEVAKRMRSALLITSCIPVFLWLLILGMHMLPEEDGNATRGFALYSMIISSVALCTWRGYAWPEPVKGQPVVRKRGQWKNIWPLLYVCLTAYVVMLGMSRTGLIAIAMTIPLSLIYRGSIKSLIRGAVMMVVGASIFAAVLFSYKPLYDRFFKEDAVKVGGVSINATGRTKIWNVLLTTIGDDWVFGKGVSASEDAINRAIPNIGQPHNDYLRFWYDQGVLGLGLWLTFLAGFVSRTITNLRRSIRNRAPDYPQHLAALLALTAVGFSMLTDNSYCYAFVMFPLAIVMGCSLGIGQYYHSLEVAAMPVESPFFQLIHQ